MTSSTKAWWRRVGTADLPVRQSLLNEYASQNGCPRRFFFRMEEELDGVAHKSASSPWKRTMGTAVHETIRRALRVAPEAVCAGRLPSRERVLRVLGEGLLIEAGGAPIDWKDASPETELRRAADMVLGGLSSLGARASQIIAAEAPFRLELAGYHIEGTIDIVFAPKDAPGAIEIGDWKTGQRKLEPVIRDHGVQLGIYGAAIQHGELWPGTDKAIRLGVAPRALWIVQLYDLVPYEKPKRKEDLGKPRGPAWYASRRSAADDARLTISLRTIVGSIRMGHRVESLGEQCGRCPYQAQCFSGVGELDARELREIERALDGIDDIDDLITRVA
jgi:hypothetical protein